MVLYHYRKCALVEGAWDTAKGVYSGEHNLEPVEVILGKIIPLPKGEVDDDDDDEEKGIKENAIAPRALPHHLVMNLAYTLFHSKKQSLRLMT